MKQPLVGGSPDALATGEFPVAISVDASFVYWTNGANGTVMKLPLGGGTPTQIESAQPGPGALALDAANLHWRTSAGVMKSPLAGGTAAALTNTIGRGLAVDDQGIYWASLGTPPDYTDSTVMKLPLIGGTALPLAAGVIQNPGGFAMDAVNIAWATNAQINAEILTMPVGGGPPTTLASGLDSPHWMGIDGANVYFTTYHLSGAPSELMELPLTGGAPRTLASLTLDDNIDAVAANATTIFWLRRGDVVTVMKATK
jgi:hypothetical protein